MAWSEELEANGFAIQSAVLPSHTIEAVETDVARSRLRSKAGLRHAMQLAIVRYISGFPTVKEIARKVLGPRAYPFRATLFDKSLASNWLVVWRQDTALPLQRRIDTPGWGPWSTKAGILYAHAPGQVLSQILALRIHLDDSTAENGPLRVLPGTHKLGLLSDDRISELAKHTAVDCLVPKRGVMAMYPLLVHASSKSRTGSPRRVLHIEYAANESIAQPLKLEVA